MFWGTWRSFYSAVWVCFAVRFGRFLFSFSLGRAALFFPLARSLVALPPQKNTTKHQKKINTVVLKPVAQALNKVLRPGVKVVLTVNGETGKSAGQYASSWLTLVGESKKRVLMNRPRCDPKDVAVGISLNYNRVAGWVDFDAVKPSREFALLLLFLGWFCFSRRRRPCALFVFFPFFFERARGVFCFSPRRSLSCPPFLWSFGDPVGPFALQC
jgi:hypothetical protein